MKKKKKKNQENWDMYLTEEAKEYYREKNYSPRNSEILAIIMDEKGLDKLPFKPTQEEIDYYYRSKSQYEEMKKKNGGEPVYFKIVDD